MSSSRPRVLTGALAATRRWWPLALEVPLRALHIPLFPGFAPLWAGEIGAAQVVYATVLAAVEMSFLGVAAWEFVAAGLAGLALARRARVGLAGAASAGTVVWALLGLVSGRFPLGALGLETLLTAVFVRAAGSEELAGLLSRACLMGLVGTSIALVSVSRRLAQGLLPATVATLLRVP